jgi:chorismate mutase
MPKAKNPMTDEERKRRFEEEVRKQEAAGDFDPERAEAVLERLVRPPDSPKRD